MTCIALELHCLLSWPRDTASTHGWLHEVLAALEASIQGDPQSFKEIDSSTSFAPVADCCEEHRRCI